MATREENLKKINDELQNMSDEELDQIAGGDTLQLLQPNQQGYYSPQGNWNQPPQGNWNQPPQGNWNQPPQGNWNQPPQDNWNQPPQLRNQ